MYNGKVTNYFTKQPIAGVPVSDGMNIVYTDEEGEYTLPGWEKAHVINVNMLTECPEDWYINIEGHKGDFDFCVKPVECGDEFSFMHVSDTEIEGRSKNDWIDFIRKTVKDEHPLFYTNTGDLCRVDGLMRHHYLMNSESVGCPVRYTIGNHDLCDGDYGDQLYEKYFGPTWFSFDCGQMHFIFLSIGCGDKSSGYSKEEREKWIEKDLELKDKDKGVIMLCHYFHPDPAGYGHTVQRMAEMAGDKGLKALIYGHLHVNSVYEYDNFIGICSSRPDSGGVDSSPAGVRKITVKGTEISTEYIYNIPESSEEETACEWCTELGENIDFCPPIEASGAVWVCTGSDSYPKKCGIYKIDIETGNILAKIETGSIKGNSAYCDGKLFAQDTMGTLYCVDTKKAEIVWTAKSDLKYLYTRRGVLVAEDKVIAGSTDSLYAYNKENGDLIWSNSIGSLDDAPSCYVYDAARRQIIVGSHWKGLYALSVDTGEIIWESHEICITHFNSSTPVIDGDVIYKRGNVEFGTVNAATGETIKKTKLCSSLDTCGACAVDDDTVYLGTASKGVIAVDKKTLETKMIYAAYCAKIFTVPYYYGEIQTVETTPVIIDDCLVFAASDGYIHIYNKKSGASLREIYVGNPVIASPVIKSKYIITADYYGKVKKYSL